MFVLVLLGESSAQFGESFAHIAGHTLLGESSAQFGESFAHITDHTLLGESSAQFGESFAHITGHLALIATCTHTLQVTHTKLDTFMFLTLTLPN